MFAHECQTFGDQLAVILPDGTGISYGELARRADDACAALTPGTLVAIECRNDLSTLTAYLGALRRRCPALLMDAEMSLPMKRQLVERYQIAHIHGDEGWRSSGGRAPKTHPDLALLLSTSGSTGSSKLVRLSHRNLEANARSIADYLEICTEDRAVTVLPIHYSYGMSVVNSHLLAGGTLLLTDAPITAKPFWQFVREQKATSISGVPTHYSILRQLRFERMSLPSLRTLTQAGGRMSADMVRWVAELAQDRGWRFFVMYGQTEAAPRMAYLPPEQAVLRPGSIGLPIPGGSIELCDTDGKPVCAPGQQGEIVYRGENVMMGYAEAPDDLMLGDIQRGELKTGDLGMLDDDGFLYVLGRLSRFIKVMGNRIGLDEVEAQLRSHGYEVAVTGEDEKLMVGYLGELDEAQILQQLFASYRLHRSSITLKRIDRFPLAPTGKLRYPDLLAMFK